MERPDLDNVDPAVMAYIESLEAELEQLRGRPERRVDEMLEPSEPPTTINVITISAGGLAKRTPRHFYSRQRRGGMGGFDLDAPEDDPPSFLLLADAGQNLLLFTNHGRAFRLPVSELPETPVRGRGQSLVARLPFSLQTGEKLAAMLPDSGSAYVLLFSERGWVRRIRSNYLGPKMLPGTAFHDPKNGGPLVAACWSPGDGDLFLLTRQGQAIRFAEQQVPVSGCRGIRVPPDDAVITGLPVYAGSGVFLVAGDGKGTIRLMSGFNANKAPGAGGKVAIKVDRVAGAVAVEESDDLFILSQLGKIIRFTAGEVPPKEGVVHGVHCISLRNDEVVAVARSQP